MKGLLKFPKTDEFFVAYRELERLGYEASVDPLSEEKIAVYSQWARLDPRLAELLTGYLERDGHKLHIFRLLRALEASPWPRSILVPLRFAELKLAFEKNPSAVSRVDRTTRIAVLQTFVKAIERAFPIKSNDLYFIPLQRLGRVMIDEMIALQCEPYSRAGFIGSASLLSKGRIPTGATLMTKGARERLLQRLIAENSRADLKEDLTVEGYVTACKGLVSRRQAQRDLETEPALKAIGFTRNRRYRRRLKGS